MIVCMHRVAKRPSLSDYGSQDPTFARLANYRSIHAAEYVIGSRHFKPFWVVRTREQGASGIKSREWAACVLGLSFTSVPTLDRSSGDCALKSQENVCM